MKVDKHKPVVALYLRYYLSPSETFVYRQLEGVSARFDPLVLTAHVSNLDLFPTERVFARGKNFLDRFGGRLARIATGGYSTATRAQREFWKSTLADHGATLIHAHFGHFALDVLPVAKSLDVPLLVTFHGFDASSLLRDTRYTRDLSGLFAYARVITVSEDMARRLEPFGLDRDRLDIHYIGVPVDNFDFVDRRPVSEKIAEEQEVRFLQVSNFVEKKGHRYTVEAFSNYVKTHPRARLTLAGDGPLKGRIEAMCGELDISGCVEFTGRVNSAEVAELMRAADVFVHHSVTGANGDMEGLPTVLMEAMSTGLPVISTRHSGIPELVDDGVNGLLVDEGDVEAYTAALESLHAANRDMGRRARETVDEKFNMAVQNARLGDIYQKVIDG
jgi:glycosyltransferase involved in cell wall biosynthesis